MAQKEEEKHDHVAPHSRICILFEVWSTLRSKDHKPRRGVVINCSDFPAMYSEPTLTPAALRPYQSNWVY